MTEVFDAYAAYYDLLYRNKDYRSEAAWIDALIQRHRPGARRLLELGCGTGAHAVELAGKGYTLTGIDQSPTMVALAQARARDRDNPEGTLQFVTGDLRDYRTNGRFDVILALFHVMSYQTRNEDLLAGMRTAAAHLEIGGVFIFDCWYGPGVLSDPPTTRVRRLQGDGFRITRITEPEHHVNANCVDVHYDVMVEREGDIEHVCECHTMRYLFEPEVRMLAQAAGLHVAACTQWLEDSPPGLGTWNACFVARS